MQSIHFLSACPPLHVPPTGSPPLCHDLRWQHDTMQSLLFLSACPPLHVPPTGSPPLCHDLRWQHDAMQSVHFLSACLPLHGPPTGSPPLCHDLCRQHNAMQSVRFRPVCSSSTLFEMTSQLWARLFHRYQSATTTTKGYPTLYFHSKGSGKEHRAHGRLPH